MNRQYESMTRVKVGVFMVRVWCSERRVVMGPRPDVVAVLKALPKGAGVDDISRALECFAPAAYEILKDGQGAIVYPDWS